MPTFSKPQAQVLEGLQKPDNKEIPFSLLYDARGSQLYEEITKLEEYYPFVAEESLLTEHAHDIAAQIPRNSIIVELGCGTARKSAILLSAVQSHHGRCKFVGIDVSASFLQEARTNLLREVEGLKPESVEVIQADYMEGLKKVRKRYPDESLCIMWLGSSVGNLSNDAATQFFRDITVAVGTHCQIFLCADMWKDKAKLYAAYHDKPGVTELFIKNGMRCALRLLDHETSSQEEDSWIYEVDINEKLRRVEMYLTFSQDLLLPQSNIHIRAGERVLVEISRKFSVGDFHRLANEAGFHIDHAWSDKIWGMQMLIPFEEALRRCWKNTDTFFHNVHDWCVKPIDVRHPFGFYYGHIQAFAKLKLLPNDPATNTDNMFSRGIDPNVVDPTQCHDHPDVPQEWPTKREIQMYVQKTRMKLLNVLSKAGIPSRLLILALEHEYMHVETLAYMRVQERKSAFEKEVACNGIHNIKISGRNNGASKDVHSGEMHGSHNDGALRDVRNGEIRGSHNNGGSNGRVNGSTTSNGVFNGHGNGHTKGHSNGDDGGTLKASRNMIRIAPGRVRLGGDPDAGTFMWDNEYPEFTTTVREAFLVSRKPVTVGEFLTFIKAGGYDRPEFWEPLDFKFFKEQGLSGPATWSIFDHGEVYVHNPVTSDHWSKVADRPVFVSLSEGEAYCKWANGRVMTEPEYHLILTSEESPKVEKIRSNGWEWTCTPFEPFPGFEKMLEYPEYSSDFFDGSHYVLKGASPVTHPSMHRDTFRNFFQRQYPYLFAKFRVCKDCVSA